MIERATLAADRQPLAPDFLEDLRDLADALCADCGAPAQVLHRRHRGAASTLCQRCADRPTLPPRPVSGAPLADYERYLAALMAR
jgi:hypothetical protein